MARLRDVLRQPNFLFLWIGQIISQFGDRLTQMALIGLIYKRYPGSAYELAKLFLFVIVPVFIVGPIAGVYCDRWNRKYTMLASDILRGLLVLLIILYWKMVPDLKPVFPVYMVVFLIFSVTRFFIPSKMSIIPDLVPADQLLQANSLINTTGMIAAMLGFGLGGILVSMPAIGVKGGLLIDAGTFFVSAVFIALISIRPKAVVRESIYDIGKKVKEIIVGSVLREVKEGLRYIITQRRMHLVIGLLFLLWSGIGAAYVVMIVFIQSSLASITRDLGLMVMLFGAGLFLGSVIYGKFGQAISRQRSIFLSLVLGGVFLVQFVLIVDLYKSFFLSAAMAFIFGASIAPVMISSNTIVHEMIPDDIRGRIFSSLEAVMHMAFLICMLLVSLLAEYIGANYILIAVGAIFACAGLVGMRLKTVVAGKG